MAVYVTPEGTPPGPVLAAVLLMPSTLVQGGGGQVPTTGQLWPRGDK